MNRDVCRLKLKVALFFQLYVNSRYAKPRFRKFGFEVYDTGNMYLIRSPAGLKLQWFHSTGMMVIDHDSFVNKFPTLGLCGKSSPQARVRPNRGLNAGSPFI